MQDNSKYPFFKEGINPIEIHKEYRRKVLDLLMKEKQPLNVSNVSETLDIAW